LRIYYCYLFVDFVEYISSNLFFCFQSKKGKPISPKILLQIYFLFKSSIAYEFIPWEEENKKLNKQNIKKPILFHCSAEIFPDEAKLLRKGRRHFPQITNKNIIYQRTLKMTPKIGTIPCENNYNKCKNGGLCFEMNNNGSKFCL